MSDTGRQQQIEMFLGMHHARDFSSVPATGALRTMSRCPPALLLRPVPGAAASLMPQSWLLGASKGAAAHAFLSAAGVDTVELVVYLDLPCRVRQLLVTVAHGLCDTTSPLTMAVKVGRYINTTQVRVLSRLVCLN